MAKATALTVEDYNLARAKAELKKAEWEKGVSIFTIKRYGKEWRAMIHASQDASDIYRKVFVK